jgi:hypothetical protein
MMNHSNEDLTMEMDEATLPVITLYQGEREINELHGYVSEMNAAYMRDTITPVGEDRKLPITIQTYQTAVDTISYEIRSLNAERLIADADVSTYEERKGKISAELTIQNLLQEDEEYLLIIELESGDRTIHYYTRIMESTDSHIEECLDFVEDFHNKTFNNETTGALATYMEKTTGDNTTLQYVSLNSSLKQVGWADLNPQRLTEPVPSVKEITGTYSVIVMPYVATSVGENGEIEYYNVQEYYRVRYTSSRMYLLNFERTVNQIFRGENDSISENYINLGIRSSDVEYKSNEAGNNIAFVQEGELWSYDVNENTLAKVFSFRGYEGIDGRENYGEHDIKIASIDEAGSIDYIVYGYMNRGIHEGEVGIAVYHYDSQANTNEEAAFLPYTQSYELMKSELGQFMYVNESGELFLMLDTNIYSINLNTLTAQKLIDNLTGQQVTMSASNRYVAWNDADDETTVHVLDLSTLESMDITENGQYVKPLGFMKEDLVYGIARKSDIFTDAAGNTTIPMYRIKIVDVSGDTAAELKTYEKDGYFISGVEIVDYTMYLNRIQYNGMAYVEADQDMIMDREGDQGKAVSVETAYSAEKQTQIQLELQAQVSEKKTKLLTPKETILDEIPLVSLEETTKTECYYVYAKGDVILSTTQVTEAVRMANDNMGVVIGDDQQYIWKRSRKTAQSTLKDISVGAEDASAGSVAQCINAMLEKEGINISVGALIEGGETPKSILKSTMKDVKVLDLTGCTVEETLYYVNLGNPVFAMTGSNDAVLIVGYDSNGVTLFDPVYGTTHRETLTDADIMFADAGSIFFAYINE